MAKNDRAVVAIGFFKLAKAACLIALGVGGLLAMPSQLAHGAERTVGWFGAFPGRETVEGIIGKIWSLDSRTAKELSVVALGYAAVFLVEGIGLIRKKRWAEWLTVVVTASFVPIEIFELVKEASAGKIVTLLLNVAIVIYLVHRRLAERRGLAGRVGSALRGRGVFQ